MTYKEYNEKVFAIEGVLLMKIVLWAFLAFIIIFFAYCALIAISSLFVDDSREYDKNSRYYRFLLNSSTAIAMRILWIKIHASGLEKVPEGERFLLVSNHRSKFDPIVTWHVLNDRQLAFISKAENFKVPVFGKIIRKCAFMSIDREDAKNAVRTINKAADMMKKDEVSMAVYPEGTRSKDCVLLPFHTGVFRIAQKADSPVVVVAVSGTEDIHRNFFRRRTHVYLEVTDVIPRDEIHKLSTNEIGARVRRDLDGALNKESKNEKVLHTL